MKKAVSYVLTFVLLAYLVRTAVYWLLEIWGYVLVGLLITGGIYLAIFFIKENNQWR